MLWIIHIHVLCVLRNSHPSTTQRVILGNSISLFCLISKNIVGFFFSATTTKKIFSFANIVSRQKNILGIPCYTKLASHNFLQLVELVINYLCSTNFVEYGILMSFLSADDITQLNIILKKL